MSRRVVVVGASLAGATTALTLRQLGFDGSVLLLGDEPHLPYERPPLSKGYLDGSTSAARLQVQPQEAYAQHDIELRLGCRAVSLDDGFVTLADGATVGYDDLVIATGSVNRRPPLPGIDLPGVHQLRTLADADALAEHAATAATVVVVGMGFVGCEVAATLRRRGLDVTMVDRLPGPLWAQLPPPLSGRVARWHLEHGVTLLGSVDVAGMEGAAAVQGVRLSDGRLLPADLVVLGVGARPATDWLAGAPLHLVQGAIGVDAHGRTTLPRVHAAGDVAAVWDERAGAHRHVEHHEAALAQARAVAHALMALPLPQEQPSWFWSEQYDHVLHYAGAHTVDDALHERAEPYSAFFVRDGVLTAVASLDSGRDFRRALRLLDSPVDPALLRDPSVDLRTLRASAAL